MQIWLSGRRQLRRLLEWSFTPSLRLPLLMGAFRLAPAQVGPGSFLRLAAEFSARGKYPDAMLCWRIVHRMAPGDASILMGRLGCALDAGDMRELTRVVEDSMVGAGISPRRLVWLAGQLALLGQKDAAAGMLSRLAGAPGAGRYIVQSPSVLSGKIPRDIRSVYTREGGNLLGLARLCFTYNNHDVAAALFARAVPAEGPLDPVDRVAMLYALADSEPAALEGIEDELRSLLATLARDADALVMLAKASIVAGQVGIAIEALRAAMTGRYPDRADLQPITADCVAMLEVLASLRTMDALLPPALCQRAHMDGEGVPKVFLCGFGWSGSGALYDDIRGVPGFCEFEGSGPDAIINEDADSEVAFVHGPGGLGRVWLDVVERGRISWDVLWDMFSLQVVGLAPIGYAGYKSAAAARNHVRSYGAAYTAPFRNFLDGYAKLRGQPRPGELHSLLLEASEALCKALIQRSGGQVVLFNNAVFGRHVPMLEIFHAHRAVVVYRDPRDVYVDRCNNDRNHWRTPSQLATFYANGLRRYVSYRRQVRSSDSRLREVPFERFVTDAGFREDVRGWLLGDLDGQHAARHFDPTISGRNIGIHKGVLSMQELRHLQEALECCRELDDMSRTTWGSTEHLDAPFPDNGATGTRRAK